MKASFAIAGLSAVLAAAPACAQDMSTLDYFLAKGVVIHAQLRGQAVDLPVTYKSDGTYSMALMGRSIDGKWRVDGDRFCTLNAMNPQESCYEIPAGKKPGDAFKVTTPAMGEATITINE